MADYCPVLFGLFSNKVLLSAGFAWVIAQGIKLITDRKKRSGLAWVFESGGFPSSHASTVVAMTLAIFLDTGVSNLFVLSLVLMMIVIQDAYKVRYQVGLHAKILNRIKKSDLNINVGHTPKEIAGGIAVGVIVAAVIFFI